MKQQVSSSSPKNSFSPISPHLEIENTQQLARLLKKHAHFTVNVRPTMAVQKEITHLLKYLPKVNIKELQLSLNENKKVSEINEFKLYFIDHKKLKSESASDYHSYIAFIRAFHPNCSVYDEAGKADLDQGVNASYLLKSLNYTDMSCVAIAKDGTLHTKSTNSNSSSSGSGGRKRFVGHLICGIMTMQYISFRNFKRDFEFRFDKFETNDLYIDKDIPSLDVNSWTVYVDVICSAFGLGGQLIKQLEMANVRKKLTMHYKTKLEPTATASQYAFISMSSTLNAYSFYSSQLGFERSFNTTRIYPILHISTSKWKAYQELLQTIGIDISDVFPVYEKNTTVMPPGYMIYNVTPLFSKLFNAVTNKTDRKHLCMPAISDDDELYLYTKRL